MNILIEDVILLFFEKGWQEIVPIFIVAALRPLGLFFGFTGIAWAISSARLIRVIMSVSIGLVMVIVNIETVEAMLESGNIVVLSAIAVTELLIGFSLGLIASLPFFALTFAGTLTDQFRGETDSGLHTTFGSPITTFGLLYTVIGLFAFAYADGFWILVKILYQSYILWPLSSSLPEINQQSIKTVLLIMGDASLMGLRLGMPLLLLLFAIELACYVGARVAQRFNFYNFAFLLKNFAVIATLPLLGTFVWMFLNEVPIAFMRRFDLIEFVQP